jgi:hypothetical protein
MTTDGRGPDFPDSVNDIRHLSEKQLVVLGRIIATVNSYRAGDRC